MTKKIGIIGATGTAGQAIVKEAVKQGFDTTAIVRNEVKAKDLFENTVSYLTKDAFELEKSDLQSFDVIVDAFAPSDVKKAYLHIDLATRLISYFREEENPRLFFILGAGSLLNGKGKHVLDDLKESPDAAAWIEAPKQQFKEFNFLSEVENVDWVGISPGILFKQGEVQPAKIGKNTILYDAKGKSETSSGTLAKVIVDEISNPKHKQERFTAIDA